MSGTIIYKTYAGSIAHGTNTPESDVDIRGIFVPPLDDVLSLRGPVDEMEGPGDDEKHFSLQKFLKLYIKANPTIIELLWTEREHWLETTPFHYMLRQERKRLLSRRMVDSHWGYARANLGRMKAHMDKTGSFDTKDAMHLVRMVRMCHEAVLTGELMVKRPDVDYLLSIRRGEVPLDDIIAEVDELQGRIDWNLKKSPLPEYSDQQEQIANKLIRDIYAVLNKSR